MTPATTGRFVFGEKPGSRVIWVNNDDGTLGNDSHDGLSFAAPKRTWNAAMAALKTGFQPGDRIRAAGKRNQYTDSHNDGMTSYAYPNATATGVTTYPTVFESYDPDDAANATKYGWLTGPDMPVLNLTAGTQASMSMEGGGAGSGIGVIGFEIVGPTATNGGGKSLVYNGNHSHIIHQNNRFKNSAVSRDGFPDTPGSIRPIGGHISHCSFWNFGGQIYLANLDGDYLGDWVSVHVGWKIGALRTDDPSVGGPQVFTHPLYRHASCINGMISAPTVIDASNEAVGNRGEAAMRSIFALDCPVGVIFGAFSTSYLEAPLGVLNTLDDFAIIGGDIIDATHPGGQAISTQNTKPGSYINNGVMFDRGGYYAPDPAQNRYLEYNRVDPAMIETFLTLSNIRGFDYAPNLQSVSGYTSLAHLKWMNSRLNVLPTSFNDTGSGNSIYSSAPVGYKTRAQLIASLGSRYSGGTYLQNKAALVNDLLYRPDLAGQFNDALLAATLPTFDLSPIRTSPSATMPSMAGITPPAVY